MPEEGYCPTCKCTVVITQQGTCPLGHPASPGAAPQTQAAPAAAPQPAPAQAPPPAGDPMTPPVATAAAGAAAAGAAAVGAGAAAGAAAPGAPTQAPGDDPFAAPAPQGAAAPEDAVSSLPAPGESDFLSGPAPEPTAAQDSSRRVSPILIIVLAVVFVLAIIAGIFIFFPELIGMGEEPAPLPPIEQPAAETTETAASEATSSAIPPDAYDMSLYYGGEYQWHTDNGNATFDYIVFLNDTEVDLSATADTYSDARGTWALEGDTLTLVHPGGLSMTGRILDLSETVLIIEGQGSYAP